MEDQGEPVQESRSSCSDKSRYNWTPSMDRYFIDLLLDQVRKGNKVGNSFSKHAWVEMIVLFGNKFGCQHDTDVLKNRFKLLRKQYTNMKTLIENGCTWDENRQILIADDQQWDGYVKAQPDRQICKSKVVPYYNELCIIYGHTFADGRYSLSCFDVDYDNEETLDNKVPIKDDSTKIDWSPTMDQYFIELMLDQVIQGNKCERTFKRKSWIHMITDFNKKFGFQYGKVVLIKRFNFLRTQYTAIKFLLSQNGFTWDEKQQMLIAEENVWNDVIKAQRYFQRYRDKVLPYYNDMCVICDNETLNFTYPLKENLSLEVGSLVDVPPEDCTPSTNVIHKAYPPKLTPDQADKTKPGGRKKRPAAMEKSARLPAKALKVDKGIEDALKEMAVAVETLTKKRKDNSHIMENVIDTLQGMPDIDDDLLLDACDYLEDESKARTFLALDGSLRKKYLMRKLRPHNEES